MSRRGWAQLAAWLLLGAAILGCVLWGRAVVPGWGDGPVQQAAAALKTDSVYIDESLAGAMDAEAARRLLGDRQIVVAVFAPSVVEQAASLCDRLVYIRDRVIALVYQGSAGPVTCVGERFVSPPKTERARWVGEIALAAELARREHPREDGDLTGVREFVVAFDIAAAADLPGGPKPRLRTDRTGTWRDVVDAVGAVLVCVGVAFLLLMWGSKRVADWLLDRRRLAAERAAAQTEFSVVAKLIARLDPATSPGIAQAVATASHEYALAQRTYRKARSMDKVVAVRHMLWRALDAVDAEGASRTGARAVTDPDLGTGPNLGADAHHDHEPDRG